MTWLNVLRAVSTEWEPSPNVERAMEAVASVINFIVAAIQFLIALAVGLVIFVKWAFTEHPGWSWGAVAVFIGAHAIYGSTEEWRRAREKKSFERYVYGKPLPPKQDP